MLYDQHRATANCAARLEPSLLQLAVIITAGYQLTIDLVQDLSNIRRGLRQSWPDFVQLMLSSRPERSEASAVGEPALSELRVHTRGSRMGTCCFSQLHLRRLHFDVPCIAETA